MLIIVSSKEIAETISKLLGQKTRVEWVGPIFYASNKRSCLNHTYEITDEEKLNDLKKKCKDQTEVYVALPDVIEREYLIKELEKNNETIQKIENNVEYKCPIKRRLKNLYITEIVFKCLTKKELKNDLMKKNGRVTVGRFLEFEAELSKLYIDTKILEKLISGIGNDLKAKDLVIKRNFPVFMNMLLERELKKEKVLVFKTNCGLFVAKNLNSIPEYSFSVSCSETPPPHPLTTFNFVKMALEFGYTMSQAMREAITLFAKGIITYPYTKGTGLYKSIYEDKKSKFFDIEEKALQPIQQEFFSPLHRLIVEKTNNVFLNTEKRYTIDLHLPGTTITKTIDSSKEINDIQVQDIFFTYNRYTEFEILDIMEEFDLFFPFILDELINNSYCTKYEGFLVPTLRGMLLTLFLKSNYKDLLDPVFVAGIDNQIEGVKKKYFKAKEILLEYGKWLDTLDSGSTAANKKDTNIKYLLCFDPCPVCGSAMDIVFPTAMKGDPYLYCNAKTRQAYKKVPNYPPISPGCGETRKLNISEKGDVKLFRLESTGIPCRKCKTGIMESTTDEKGISFICSDCKNRQKVI